ncbi:MAG: primosomal protein N', partial [Tissierellaceae bacterium]
AIVIKILDDYNDDYKLKSIEKTLDNKPLISNELIELGIWMRDYYLSSYMDALQLVLPPGDFKKINTFVSLNKIETPKGLNAEEISVINYLEKSKRKPLDKIKGELKIPGINKILNSLEDKGLIELSVDIRTTIDIRTERWIRILSQNIPLEQIYKKIGKRASKQREIIKFLYEIKDISFKDFSRFVNTSLSTVKSLEGKGLVELYEKEVGRQPIKKEIADYLKHQLSDEQKAVFNRIIRSFYGEDKHNKFLIHGVTGSGKTEIYLQLVEEMLKMGKDSIVLVPEISLTPQTIDRFVGRFGDLVALLHSKLSYGERFDEWRKIKEGRAKIVIGARSAVFAPFKNLGLIIIDEEHESSYKSSQSPKYNTIEVAGKRAQLESGFLVVGSATPSLETYFSSLHGDYLLLELKERINNYDLPSISLVDMREELNKGNKSIFSEKLYNSILENLEKGRQTILFLNRRGFSTFVSCRNCGYVVKCQNCDISMTYHRNINKLRCHYCGLAMDPPKICPICKSNYIKYFGIGTEKVEEVTRELFPQARIARMDMDTTTRKGSHENILEAMKKGKLDILIGTQMISKGLDFKNVTLVGIIAADITLNLPDFRSPERTFQLITQVAGRAGRGDYKGEVILQTYNPEHYSIVLSKDHNYKEFYEMEIKLREEFLYPPHIRLVSILIYGEDKVKVASYSKEIYNLIVENISWIPREKLGKYLIGPYPAPLEKISNNFRWLILIKTEEKDFEGLKSLVKRVCINNEFKLQLDRVKTSIQIDPNSIL